MVSYRQKIGEIGDPLQKIHICLRMVRARFFTASLLPVLLGTVMAAKSGGVPVLRFLLVLAGALLYHAGANMINDVYDEATDRINRYHSPFNGGSRVLQEEGIKPSVLRRAALLTFISGFVFVLLLMVTGGGWGVLLLGAVGLFGGVFYSAPPFRFSARAWGELLIGLCFGPMLVAGTELALSGGLQKETLITSIPLGILIMAVIFINEFPDWEADQTAGKRNMVVRMGRERGIELFGVMLTLAYLMIIVNVLLFGLPLLSVLSLLTIPLAVRAYRIGKLHSEEPRRILPACAATIGVHFFTGLILILTLWFGR